MSIYLLCYVLFLNETLANVSSDGMVDTVFRLMNFFFHDKRCKICFSTLEAFSMVQHRYNFFLRFTQK